MSTLKRLALRGSILDPSGSINFKETDISSERKVAIIYLSACTEFEFRMDYQEDGGAQLVVTDQFRFAKHFGR